MNRRKVLKKLATVIPALYLSNSLQAVQFLSTNFLIETISQGPFSPNWASLQKYQVPSWYRDAKFGIWAHWGPQCQPESGDWYARSMYQEGSKQYKFHLEKYGHPSVFGFKDIINTWKAEKWNPDALVSMYKNAGAQYFVAMANHHDNLDLFKSKYQKNWNSTNIGPKKDIVGGWSKAAKKYNLPFGVSVHAAHAWSWFETSQRSDKTGAFAGIPYDGKLTKEDGKGKWWDGLDPQELYAQDHQLSENSSNNSMIHKQWDWGHGVTPPSKAYIDKFMNRTLDLINQYKPDLVYFDDSQFPMWPISDAGLKIAAHMYNKSIKDNGYLRAVINGKILNESQRKAMVWDIERGQSNSIESLPWQTCTCIGNWHYDRSLYDRKGYKTAKSIIHTLIDVVSKNGNLLLNVPVRGDGSIDEIEVRIVNDIGIWMKRNGESIYGTRPWKIFGEGPAQENVAPLSAQGFNEGKGRPFGAEDIRFTTKEDILYAIILGLPENGKVLIKSLSENNRLYPQAINKIDLCGGGRLDFKRSSQGLEISLPALTTETDYAFAIKIS